MRAHARNRPRVNARRPESEVFLLRRAVRRCFRLLLQLRQSSSLHPNDACYLIFYISRYLTIIFKYLSQLETGDFKTYRSAAVNSDWSSRGRISQPFPQETPWQKRAYSRNRKSPPHFWKFSTYANRNRRGPGGQAGASLSEVRVTAARNRLHGRSRERACFGGVPALCPRVDFTVITPDTARTGTRLVFKVRKVRLLA